MVRWMLLGACVSSLALIEGDAMACGGCFHQVNPPPEERTVVTGHRMAFSISTSQTILWDQVEYSGNPADFAWVLPVFPGAVIESSRDEWFAALDAATQPVINGPVTYASSIPQGQGCAGAQTGCSSASDGTDNAASAGSPGTGGGAVQVLSQGVVGPYDTVTLKSSDPNALTDWLTAHGYDIPASIAPTIDQYVAGGFDFIALRLRPQCGVNAMQPVRIVTPGADPTLPLRMVAAGAGAEVAITLWIVGEGRWTTQNFPAATLSDSQLTWDTTQSISNYETLAGSTMAEQNGTTWLTEYAGSIASSVYYPSSYGSTGYSQNPSLAQAYYAFCGGTLPSNGSSVVPPTPCTQASPPPASAPDASDASDDAEGPDADDAGEAGAGYDAGITDPATMGCDAFDDLSVALSGIDPDSVWLTRIRANLPVQALGTDLLLMAAQQSPVTNLHYVPQPAAPAPSSGGSCESVSRGGDAFGTATLLTLTGAALATMLRRRRA